MCGLAFAISVHFEKWTLDILSRQETRSTTFMHAYEKALSFSQIWENYQILQSIL
jgi:NADH:ubiquinone oxidoreductase subunit 2 (subunit N)